MSIRESIAFWLLGGWTPERLSNYQDHAAAVEENRRLRGELAALERNRQAIIEERDEFMDERDAANREADKVSPLIGQVADLGTEISNLEAERDNLQHQNRMHESKIAQLESEVEFLVAWREKELNRLRLESTISSVRENVILATGEGSGNDLDGMD